MINYNEEYDYIDLQNEQDKIDKARELNEMIIESEILTDSKVSDCDIDCILLKNGEEWEILKKGVNYNTLKTTLLSNLNISNIEYKNIKEDIKISKYNCIWNSSQKEDIKDFFNYLINLEIQERQKYKDIYNIIKYKLNKKEEIL